MCVCVCVCVCINIYNVIKMNIDLGVNPGLLANTLLYTINCCV